MGNEFSDMFEVKNTNLVGLLMRQLERVDETGTSIAEQLAERLVCMALAGDVEAMKVILDRVDGPIPSC